MESQSVPRSPWTDTAAPAPETPPLAGDTQTDVAIVGAGFTGLSTALHLREKGIGTVVLEAAEPGFGGSGRNGGQVIPGLKQDPAQIAADFGSARGEAITSFVGGAADATFGIIERHGIDCEARRVGWIQGVHAPVAMPAVERRCKAWAARGADVAIIDGAEFERRTGARGYHAGFFDGRGGTVNPLAFARGLARAAQGLGAAIHCRTPALSLTRRGDKWEIATPQGRVTANRVLLATGAYSGDLWPGLRQSMVTFYSYQIATRPLGGNLRQKLVPGGLATSDTRRLLSYCRQDARGRLLVGGRGLLRESSDPADFIHIRRALARMFPEAVDLELEFFWGGRVGMTLDHYPHFAEPAPGLTVAVGYNGRGVALGSAAGAALADHLAGKPLEEVPLPARPYRPLPFHGLRAPVVSAMIHAKRMQDWWETRG